MYETSSSFPLVFVWSTTQLTTIEEVSTVVENGWCVLGVVRIASFVEKVSNCGTIFSIPLFQINSIFSKKIIQNLQINMNSINKVRMEVDWANEPYQFNFWSWRERLVGCCFCGLNWFHCVKTNLVTNIFYSEKHEKDFWELIFYFFY